MFEKQLDDFQIKIVTAIFDAVIGNPDVCLECTVEISLQKERFLEKIKNLQAKKS